MPRQPDASFQPAVEIDIDKTYPVELVEIEEQPSKFRDRNKDANTLIHRFRIFDPETGAALIDESTGSPYEHWHFTPDSTFSNPTSGQVAKARVVANALMNKTLSDDDVKAMITAGWDKSLVGKRALADFDWVVDNNGNERLRIIRFRPYRKPGSRAVEAPAVEAPATETLEERKARLIAELEAMQQ